MCNVNVKGVDELDVYIHLLQRLNLQDHGKDSTEKRENTKKTVTSGSLKPSRYHLYESLVSN